MGKGFIYGERKNRKRKSRMIVFNKIRKLNSNAKAVVGPNQNEENCDNSSGTKLWIENHNSRNGNFDNSSGTQLWMENHHSDENALVRNYFDEEVGMLTEINNPEYDNDIVTSNDDDLSEENKEQIYNGDKSQQLGISTETNLWIENVSTIGEINNLDWNENEHDLVESDVEVITLKEQHDFVNNDDSDERGEMLANFGNSTECDLVENGDCEGGRMVENFGNSTEADLWIENDSHNSEIDNIPKEEHDLVEIEDLGEDDENQSDNGEMNNIPVDLVDNEDSDEDDHGMGGNVDISAASRIEGRRLVEMDFFFKQLTDISDHNYGDCLYSDMVVRKEIKNGFRSNLIFQCNKCGTSFPVLTSEDEKTTDTLCLNATAVLASNMIGIGFTQLEQLSSVLDVPCMCADRFKSLNDDVGALWEMTAEESMKAAAEEERQAAIERGDIDEEDDIPYITVVTDACWSKRSYNKNFTALSGVSAIVGATFGKVLWIGVKNKYCVVCVRNANQNLTPPDHFCTRNYSGPSSDMEWKSIVQGFENSVDLYNLRYMKVIADSDSSTYLKILETKPYQHRHVEKDECCNHLLRNFRKQLDNATTGCPRGLTKHVTICLERIRKDVCCAVKVRAKEDKEESEKISLLKSDLNNIVHHVFGDHQNCPDYIKTFCNAEEQNHIPALIISGTYDKIATPLRKLVYCAKDLLLGETNNVAEHYNSIVAKFVGGKRVNFSLSNAYGYRANASAVHFNTQTPLTAFYRTAFQKDPPALTRKIELKRLQKSLLGKERRKRNKEHGIRPKRFNDVKETGSGYGINCQTTDIPVLDFENEKKLLIEKLKEHQANRIEVEEQTRLKYKCARFRLISSKALMTSNFGPVCKARMLSNRVKDISKEMFTQSKAKRHNNESQAVALQQLAREQQLSVRDFGLYIDKEHECLAASPTGCTNDGDIIIEIQCSIAIVNKDPNDPSALAKLSYIQVTKEKEILGLKKSSDIYYQIQGQIHICEKNICIFSIWTSNQHKMYVEKITKDDVFFNTKMKDRLLKFYYDWLLPELIDPRLKRNMTVRIPE